VIKIKGTFENSESYSFMLTGDADTSTLNRVIKLDFNKPQEAMKNIFEDVILFLIPHHGSMIPEHLKILSQKILFYFLGYRNKIKKKIKNTHQN